MERTLADYCRDNPDGFEVRDGLICSPGKFEGEPLYVPFYYDLALSGFADEIGTLRDGTSWDAFDVSEDASKHAECFSGDTSDADTMLILYYSDSGFVSSDLATQAEFEAWSKNPECQDFGEDREDSDA